MAEPISIQQLKDASEDAITLADFIYKPANVMIPRRLAADINSLQYYLDYMSSYAQRSYETYDEMVANAVNLPNGVSAFVTNDLDATKNGIYTYNGSSFVKGDYQPENAAKDYVEAKLGGLQVFDGKVRAQDVSTSDGSTQDVKNNEFRNELDGLPPFEGGVLADTFVTATTNGVGTVARTQRDINSNITYAKSFGAKGDGVTDDSLAINTALLTLSDLAKDDGQPRALVLDPNSTYIARNIRLQPLVDLICLTGVATIKRTPVPEGTPESEAKWWRVMSVASERWTTDADYDYRVNLTNIVLDGNYNNSRWTWNTYSQEQAANLILHGENNADITKRTKFAISNVSTLDSVADGLHAWVNTDVIINNSFAKNCFRGGMVVTGGNSVIRIDGWTAENARTDMEVDSVGSGGSRQVKIYVRNYHQDIDGEKEGYFGAGIDVGSVGNGGVLDFDNVNIGSLPFHWHMGEVANEKPEKYQISNSKFNIGNVFVYNPVAGLVKDTKFILRNEKDQTSRLAFFINYLDYTQDTDTDLVFDNVTFECKSQAIEHKLTSSPISIESQVSTNKARIKVINSDLSKIICDGYSFACNTGGRLYVDEVKISTKAGLLKASGEYNHEDSSYPVNLTIGKIHFADRVEGFMLPMFTPNNDNTLEFLPNCVVPARFNVFPSANQNGSAKVKIGHRTIISDTPPAYETQAYRGDVFRLSTVSIGLPFEWVATNDKINHGGEVSWRPTKWAFGNLASSSLPYLTGYDVGTTNYDTTLGKVVTWVGSGWV